MHTYGLPDETCLPYNATDYKKFKDTNYTCPPEAYCMNCFYEPGNFITPKCFPVTKVIRYRAIEYGRISGEYEMMKELANGPITCGMSCSNEFSFEYSAGIFEDKTNFMEIDHDVEIVGWGEEDGVKYWHVRNSWGTYWGMNGFFKILRGTNNLGIESDCHYMVPDVSSEDLVWNKRPAYGGSHYGIKPFSNAGLKIHVPDTSDVTLDSTQIKVNEIIDKKKNPIMMESVDLKTNQSYSFYAYIELFLVLLLSLIGTMWLYNNYKSSTDKQVIYTTIPDHELTAL